MSETRASSDGEAGVRQTSESVSPVCCPVVELRQYTLKPGRRNELIALFERHFLEGQEQYGMQILGQFRRRTDPDQFVWLRGFADMEARRRALQDFYFGPLWQVHRTAGGIVIATVYAFDEPVGSPFVDFFETKIAPVLCAAGASLLGYYVTESAENTFPQLPVREGEHVFVWFASFADEEAYAAYQMVLMASQAWPTSLLPALQGWLSRPEEVLELAPTRRSILRHRWA